VPPFSVDGCFWDFLPESVLSSCFLQRHLQHSAQYFIAQSIGSVVISVGNVLTRLALLSVRILRTKIKLRLTPEPLLAAKTTHFALPFPTKFSVTVPFVQSVHSFNHTKSVRRPRLALE